jgi:hypothetical protein
VRARRIRPLHRGERALTPQAIEELFRSAEVLTEGGLDGDPEARWYGSIMITFDLGRLVRRCRGLSDPALLDRVVDAIEGSVRVRIRAHRMACAEVYRRFPDRTVGTAQLESCFRRDGDLLLLDIDLEAPIDLPSRRSAT